MSDLFKQRPNAWIKTGTIMFFLWGVLHMYAGGLMSIPFFTQGPGANLAVIGIAMDKPLSPDLIASSHIALNFGLDLAGYGVLAIWLSVMMWQGRNMLLNYTMLVVMLGIADAAFIYSLLMPGYSPLLEGIAGPLLYTLGVMLSGFGLFITHKRKQNNE